MTTSCVKLIANYSVRQDIRPWNCIHSCMPPKRPKNYSPVLEVMGTVTHCRGAGRVSGQGGQTFV